MTTFTFVHVVLSLVGIGSGVVVLYGMIRGKRMDSGTALFLATTILTSLTGFFFPFHGVTPGIVVGIVSIVVLAAACYGRYVRHMAGAWRPVYVIGATVALYFNVVVLIIQLFEKVAGLKAVAPTQSEPPFIVTQLVVIAAFGVAGFLAVKRFRFERAKAVEMAKAA